MASVGRCHEEIPLALSIVAAIGGGALAQPGQTDPEPPSPYPAPPPQPQPYPQPPPQPYPQPQPYVPPPQSYVPQGYVQAQLTADDAKLLQQGEISDGQLVGGVVANFFVGFGLGQALQGRWGETGWIFALGEAGSLTALIVGFVREVDCLNVDTTCNKNSDADVLFWGGLIGYGIFHIWSIVDAATGPSQHNRKVRELRMRLGIPQPMYTRIVPYVNKTHDSGAAAGITFRF